MDASTIASSLGVVVVVAPLGLLALLGIGMLVGRPFDERATARSTQVVVIVGLLCALVVLATMLLTDDRYVPVELGDWVLIPQEHFHFRLKFVFDRLSVPFVILTYGLVGTVGAFANRYLHREAGYRRFFLLYAVFLLGMVVASLAGTIETLFAGWELVGLSSALLVAYLHERRSPVANGQRVWSVYRLGDAAFLVAAVALHHVTGAGDFEGLMGSGPWPAGTAALGSGDALFVGSLLLLAAAVKSALVPFSGWLPRAMEGPTPSSAIFYGALSVHLGVFMLLRVSPILELSIPLSVAVVTIGLVTAVFASVASSVQADLKSAVAFASLTQVGIITAEIGLGFRYLPLVHIIGNACLRTMQLLRASSVIHDYHTLENAIGGHLNHEPSDWTRRLPQSVQRRLYRLALDRGNLDAFLHWTFVRPFVCIFEWCDGAERRWTDLLSGKAVEPPPAERTPSLRSEERA